MKSPFGWNRMVVVDLKMTKNKKNPLAYVDGSVNDFIESVEEFFEAADIKVDNTEVERIASDLANNGVYYWDKYMFNAF